MANYLKLWKTFVDEPAADIPEISVPSNLRSRRYVVKAANPQIVTFETGEVAAILEQASDRLELYLLLMLNCGMTQQDIADLQASEVDFEAGRIIRRRSKEANAPLVNWLLWDRTAEMLAEQGYQDGNVLRKVDGGPLVESGIQEDGREFRRDAIVSNWRHLVAKCKRRELLAADWHKTLKDFRKTGATVIERSPDAEFVDMFLDHSRVARQHYLKGQVVPKFDRAVVWLGEQFGLATSDVRFAGPTV